MPRVSRISRTIFQPGRRPALGHAFRPALGDAFRPALAPVPAPASDRRPAGAVPHAERGADPVQHRKRLFRQHRLVEAGVDLGRRPARKHAARRRRVVGARNPPVDRQSPAAAGASGPPPDGSGTSTHTSGKAPRFVQPQLAPPYVRRVIDPPTPRPGNRARRPPSLWGRQARAPRMHVYGLVGLQDAPRRAVLVALQEVHRAVAVDGRPRVPRQSGPRAASACATASRDTGWSARRPTPSRWRRPRTPSRPSQVSISLRGRCRGVQPGNVAAGVAGAGTPVCRRAEHAVGVRNRPWLHSTAGPMPAGRSTVRTARRSRRDRAIRAGAGPGAQGTRGGCWRPRRSDDGTLAALGGRNAGNAGASSGADKTPSGRLWTPP